MARFHGVTLTPASLGAARRWFADNALHCIDDALGGRVRVNNLADYVAWRRESARAVLAGESDSSLAFLQRAYYLQTGECPALLP